MNVETSKQLVAFVITALSPGSSALRTPLTATEAPHPAQSLCPPANLSGLFTSLCKSYAICYTPISLSDMPVYLTNFTSILYCKKLLVNIRKIIGFYIPATQSIHIVYDERPVFPVSYTHL